MSVIASRALASARLLIRESVKEKNEMGGDNAGKFSALRASATAPCNSFLDEALKQT